MSIKMKNPKTILEKIDVVTNLIEQMNLSNQLGDNGRFHTTCEKTVKIIREITELLQDEVDGE